MKTFEEFFDNFCNDEPMYKDIDSKNRHMRTVSYEFYRLGIILETNYQSALTYSCILFSDLAKKHVGY